MSDADNRIFKALKALPLIRFALMLGGGVTMTAGTAWIIAVIAHAAWPAVVAADRIDALKWLGLGALGIIGIVMVALAWGKADRIRFGVGQVSAEVEFEDEK